LDGLFSTDERNLPAYILSKESALTLPILNDSDVIQLAISEAVLILTANRDSRHA
jgi:hypothetical protein